MCAGGADGADDGGPGEAVQIDPIKSKLKPPGTKLFKLNCDVLLSTSAFRFNLRRYKPALTQRREACRKRVVLLNRARSEIANVVMI